MAFISKGCLGLLTGFLFIFNLESQIPEIGSEGRLDVMTWNIEWFGNSSNGPSNDDLQLQYVNDIINTIKVDLIAVQEISDVGYWNRLLFNCQDYSGVLSTWTQTQKTGLLYKKGDFDFLYQKHILANYEYDFGGGRLPLEVGLIPKHPSWPKTDTLRIWVLHMKANTGSASSKVLAYNRRYNAGLALKLYIDNLGKSNKGIVLGDWNDDFDQSILTGYASPYQNWIKDTNYVVNSYDLSLSKQRSTVGYSDMIDHIVSAPGMKLNWIKDSTMVLNADKWISNYGNVVSDHFPVYARFNWENHQLSTVRLHQSNIKLVYVSDTLYFKMNTSVQLNLHSIDLYDVNYKHLSQITGSKFHNPVKNKWYIYKLSNADESKIKIGMFLISDDGCIISR